MTYTQGCNLCGRAPQLGVGGLGYGDCLAIDCPKRPQTTGVIMTQSEIDSRLEAGKKLSIPPQTIHDLSLVAGILYIAAEQHISFHGYPASEAFAAFCRLTALDETKTREKIKERHVIRIV